MGGWRISWRGAGVKKKSLLEGERDTGGSRCTRCGD